MIGTVSQYGPNSDISLLLKQNESFDTWSMISYKDGDHSLIVMIETLS